MKLNKLFIYFFPIAIFICSCQSNQESKIPSQNPSSQKVETESARTKTNLNANSIVDRIETPNGYSRTKLSPLSFEHYLRNQPLKPFNAPVKYFDGSIKSNNNIYHSVIKLDIGDKDLHQCADAVMRLRAEYLWKQKKYEDIHFNFTNGFQVDYTEWMNGKRMIVQGNKTNWKQGESRSNEYKDFWEYMELIFMYAGTASLEKEMHLIEYQDAKIGDVLIQGGHPGHAVIIIDQASNKDGENIYLLAQSYMPAQEIHILLNPSNEKLSPWYTFQKGQIKTPEWNFRDSDFKRFEK